jgi:hypothetical protein
MFATTFLIGTRAAGFGPGLYQTKSVLYQTRLGSLVRA